MSGGEFHAVTEHVALPWDKQIVLIGNSLVWWTVLLWCHWPVGQVICLKKCVVLIQHFLLAFAIIPPLPTACKATPSCNDHVLKDRGQNPQSVQNYVPTFSWCEQSEMGLVSSSLLCFHTQWFFAQLDSDTTTPMATLSLSLLPVGRYLSTCREKVL